MSRYPYINPVKPPMQKTSTLVSTILKTTKNKQQKATPVVDEIGPVEPSDSLIQNILNYSKSLTVTKSESVGFIEVVAS